MPVVRSEKYPELRVVPVGVQFRDGLADVDDEAVLARLRKLGRFGVVVPDPEPAKGTPDGAPKRARRKR